MKICLLTALFTVLALNGMSAEAPDSLPPAHNFPRFNTNWSIDRNSPFLDVNCPLVDGLTMWLHRQNLATRGFQTIVDYQYQFDYPADTGHSSPHLELYVPVLATRYFSGLLGFAYWQASVLPNQGPQYTSLSSINQNLWFWSAWQYIPDDHWNFTLMTEYYQRGNQESFQTAQGNEFFTLMLVSYAFDRHWYLFTGAGYDWTWQETSLKASPLAVAQVKWVPHPTFSILAGVPVLLSLEWSPLDWLAMGANLTVQREIRAFVSFALNRGLSLSANYCRSTFGSDDIYFTRKTWVNTGTAQPVVQFNQAEQYQNQIFIQLACKPSSEMSLQLKTGYSQGEEVILKRDGAEQARVGGRSGLLAGVSLTCYGFPEQ